MISINKNILWRSFKNIKKINRVQISRYFGSSKIGPDEYIEGFDELILPQKEAQDIKKKFVNYENVKLYSNNQQKTETNQKFKEEAPNNKQEIEKSFQRVQQKLGLEFEENDEYYKTLEQKQEEEVDQIISDQQKENYYNEYIQDCKRREVQQKQISEQIEQDKQQQYTELISRLRRIDRESPKTPEGVEQSYSTKYIKQVNKMKSRKQRETNAAYYDYLRGEENVDHVSISEEIVHEEAGNIDSINRLVLSQINEEQGNIEDLLQNLRDRQTMDLEELVKNAEPYKIYPGSPKGPYPENDPETYADWYLKNIPQHTRDFLDKVSPREVGVREDVIKSEIKEMRDVQESNLISILSQDNTKAEIGFTKPEESLMNQMAPVYAYSSPDQTGYLPIPYEFTQVYQDAQEQIEKWNLFRAMPTLYNTLNKFGELLRDLQSGIIQLPNERPRHSLYYYYYLLPDIVRNEQFIKNIVKNLEFNKHDITPAQKEKALNYAAQFVFPLDQTTEEICAENIESRLKFFVPFSEEKKILNQFEEEDIEAEISIKKKKRPVFMLPEISEENDPKQGDWPRPTPPNTYTSDEDPNNIPIDFYDNEDGFWNDYISYKENQYTQIPISFGRKYFKH